jgi:ribosomal protein L11 methyltransferase
VSTDWFEIAVPAEDAVADDLAALLVGQLGDAGAGIEQRAGELVYWVRPDRVEPALAATRAALAALARTGLAVDPTSARVRPAVPEVEWRDAWKRYFKVTYLTRQLVVVPSWERHEPAAGDLVMHLDPGQAFGTGAHASTRLVLEELQRLRDEGAAPRRILDLGTGSGILSIAAARLWPAAELVAVDSDPLAVATARENFERNAVDARTSTDAVADLPGRFELVVANIQADVLEALADGLRARVAPGGALVLSGLLSPQAPEVAASYAARDMAIEAIRASELDPAWSAVRLRAVG